MLVEKIGRLADRLSVNIELPSETSLTTLAPRQKKTAILRPMGQIAVQSAQSKRRWCSTAGPSPFAPAGQSTQMIIGATPETDRHIMDLTEGLYRKYSLKRVYQLLCRWWRIAAWPATARRPLPCCGSTVCIRRTGLLRLLPFFARELLTEDEPNFDPYLDPKCTWAVRHPEFFPVEVNTAGRAELLRVPGIGPKSALRIVEARRVQSLGMAELKRIGVVLKRAQYFITCKGKAAARGSARRSRGRCLIPRRSAWGCSSFRWTILYPRPCPTLPRLCKGWRRAAWRRMWPPGRCGRRHCNVLRSACDRHSYCYDGSFAGFLCCVFESYARKEIPAEVCPPEEEQLNFFGTRQIFTDEQHARRVAAGLNRLGREVKDRVTTGFSLHRPRQGPDTAAVCAALLCAGAARRADAGRPGRAAALPWSGLSTTRLAG